MPHGPLPPPTPGPVPPEGEASEHHLLARAASLASRAVPGARWASASIGAPFQPHASAADSAQAQAADGLQWRADEGPVAEAFRTGGPVVSPDLSAGPRWSRLAGLAAGGEVRCALAVPLRSGEHVVGVLAVYSDTAGGIDPDADRVHLVGDAASALVAAGKRIQELQDSVENLRTAMRSRAAIEQAKGVVAARLGCDVDQAFEALSSLSQDRNVKLRELAALVASDPSEGELDGLLRAALVKVAARAAAAAPAR